MNQSPLYAQYLQFCAGAPPRRSESELTLAVTALQLEESAVTWESFWGKLNPAWFWGDQDTTPFNDERQANQTYRSLTSESRRLPVTPRA